MKKIASMHPATYFHHVQCNHPQYSIAPTSPCRLVDAATPTRNIFPKMFLAQELSVVLNPHQGSHDAREDGGWRQDLQYISHQRLDVVVRAPSCQCRQHGKGAHQLWASRSSSKVFINIKVHRSTYRFMVLQCEAGNQARKSIGGVVTQYLHRPPRT